MRTPPNLVRRPAPMVAASLVLLVLAGAPFALAQGTPPKKKGAKPAPGASASAPAAAPTPTPTPEPAPPPAPESSASAETPKAVAKTEVASSGDGGEDPTKKYKFIGLRYRGTVIPKFVLNLFVNEGATIFSHTFGFEYDMRHEEHSTILSLAYTSYGTGDILFLDKNPKDNNPDNPANFSVVNSSLKALFFGIDQLWSTAVSPQVDFEYGFGVGIGVVFGSLQNNWVYANSGGPYTDSKGRTYSMCQSEADNVSCTSPAHQNNTPAKVGGYTEKNWLNGGSVPVLFPRIQAPILGMRYHTKPVEFRLGIGFALTEGFFFGISGDYGIPEKAEGSKAARRSRPARPAF